MSTSIDVIPVGTSHTYLSPVNVKVTVQVEPALQSGVGFVETAVEGAINPPIEVRRVARSNNTLNLAMPRMKRSLRG
jgi:riboflavin synthase alpha subunit